MAQLPLELRDVTIVRVGTVKKSTAGHPFLECESGQGIVAFWGFGEETANIEAVQAAKVPFVVRCQCAVPTKTVRHALWVPWSSPLFIQATGTPQTSTPLARRPFDPDAAREEIGRLGRVLGSVLDKIEGKRPVQAEGLVPRVRRLSQDEGRIPRKIAALMILVAELRNSAAHDDQPITETESNAARMAWQAVTEWSERGEP